MSQMVEQGIPAGGRRAQSVRPLALNNEHRPKPSLHSSDSAHATAIYAAKVFPERQYLFRQHAPVAGRRVEMPSYNGIGPLQMRCPKCQFDHPLQTIECLKCGIVFSRYRPALRQPTGGAYAGEQKSTTSPGRRRETTDSSRDPSQNGCRTGGWITDPGNRPLQVEIFQQIPMRFQLCWQRACGQHRTLGIEKKRLIGTVVHQPDLNCRCGIKCTGNSSSRQWN